jgi:hypothetical protein
MRTQKSFLISAICLFLGFIATISLAQEIQGEFLTGESGAGAKLVVTSVSGPATAIHNRSISVTYTVQNQGTVASGAYYVDLYLSIDKTINPAAERLLKNVWFSTGLAQGQSKQTTTKVLVPINGLSGKYYYGAVVGSSKRASAKRVSLVRYSLGDNNETVTDHKTSLIWQRTDDGTQRNNFDDANQYCGDLVLGGYSDWRLPRIDELETILDYSRYHPAIDPLFSCHSDVYWSGSTDVSYLYRSWHADFGIGYVGPSGAPDYVFFVRCVRGGPEAPTPTVPGAPTGVTAFAGNAVAIVIFTAPASDGGKPIISFTVTSNPGGKTASGDSSPITVTGLANGKAYTFTAKATNAVGSGPASRKSNSVTPDPAAGYLNNGDGTVTDNKTGLMWQQADDWTKRTWADAGQYCASLVLGGHDDWRLPPWDEILTIVDDSRHPAIHPVFTCRSEFYWSSSTYDPYPANAYAVQFYDGAWSILPKFSIFYARCVRDGP